MLKTLSEEGTKQFTVETVVNGKSIKVQSIHDPFIHTKIVTQLSWWSCFCGLFLRQKRTIDTRVTVRGSQGAQRAIMMFDPQRAIMMFDPDRLRLDTEEILESRRISREASRAMCYLNGSSSLPR